MTSIASHVTSTQPRRKAFCEIAVGDFVVAGDHLHAGMKINESTIRWFQNTPLEYCAGSTGLQTDVRLSSRWEQPLSVELTVRA